MDNDVDTVLVTGATGFVATNIIRLFLEQDKYKVRGTVRSLKDEDRVGALKKLCPNAKYPLELVEAELLDENVWNSAIRGCKYVIHVAGPTTLWNPPDVSTVSKPIIDGTLNVLKACKTSGSVKRVVLTGTIYNIHHSFGNTADEEATKTYTEDDWADPTTTDIVYVQSKIAAEKEAWKFIEELNDDEKFELVAVEPVLVFGPVSVGPISHSETLLQTVFESTRKMFPKVGLDIIDVRDTALAHLHCMELPEAAGNRYLLHNTHITMVQIGRILDKEFGHQGYSFPSIELPDWTVKLMSHFDKSLQMFIPFLGRTVKVNNDKMTRVLKINPRKIEDTVIDMAYSMIETGKLKKNSRI